MAKSVLKNMSMADIEAELRRRQSKINELLSERQKIVDKLLDIDEKIKDIDSTLVSSSPAKGGKKSGKRGRKSTTKKAAGKRGRPIGRPRNALSLGDAIAKVISKDQPMTISEIIDAVKRVGYKTKSSNFRVIVNQTLTKDDRFKKIERGKYVAA